jgi:iron complex transport system substrate-binding protein
VRARARAWASLLARTLSVLVLAALASGSACSRPKAPPAIAARVVSLSPSTTETLFAIGARAAVVGRSRFCDYPPEVLALPVVGGYVDPSFEAILALRPDLVVGARGPSGAGLTEKLAARGITTYFPETESFAQIDAMIAGIGQRTGRADDALRVTDAIHAREVAIEHAVATLGKRRVLLVFGLEPIVVAGPGGFPDEMLRRAGGVNVVTSGGAYPTIGMERVFGLDADVILDASVSEAHGAERIRADSPGWSSVRAVKEGHVVALADEAVLRPGPRIDAGLAIVARALHPDAALP